MSTAVKSAPVRVAMVACPVCGGDGWITEYRKCLTCLGRGKVEADRVCAKCGEFVSYCRCGRNHVEYKPRLSARLRKRGISR